MKIKSHERVLESVQSIFVVVLTQFTELLLHCLLGLVQFISHLVCVNSLRLLLAVFDQHSLKNVIRSSHAPFLCTKYFIVNVHNRRLLDGLVYNVFYLHLLGSSCLFWLVFQVNWP